MLKNLFKNEMKNKNKTKINRICIIDPTDILLPKVFIRLKRSASLQCFYLNLRPYIFAERHPDIAGQDRWPPQNVSMLRSVGAGLRGLSLP